MKVTESQLRKFIQGALQENKEKTVLREQGGNLKPLKCGQNPCDNA
jgi:hypothetical protein